MCMVCWYGVYNVYDVFEDVCVCVWCMCMLCWYGVYVCDVFEDVYVYVVEGVYEMGVYDPFKSYQTC